MTSSTMMISSVTRFAPVVLVAAGIALACVLAAPNPAPACPDGDGAGSGPGGGGEDPAKDDEFVRRFQEAQQLFGGAGYPRPAVPGYGTISKAFAAATAICPSCSIFENDAGRPVAVFLFGPKKDARELANEVFVDNDNPNILGGFD